MEVITKVAETKQKKSPVVDNKLWWDKKWGKNKSCGITQMRLRPGKDIFDNKKCVFLDCGHGFYRSAIIEWYNSCQKPIPDCPLCRKPINILKFF